MQTERLVNHQIVVKVSNEGGQLTVLLPDGQKINWPIRDTSINAGEFYITLASFPTLPSKEELAKIVLREILKLD